MDDADRPLRIRMWRRHERFVTIEHTRDLAANTPEADRLSAAVHAYSRTLAGVGAEAAASKLAERLRAIIDWADLALRNPQEFDSHGVRNLDGPVFDAAREVLAALPPAPAVQEQADG